MATSVQALTMIMTRQLQLRLSAPPPAGNDNVLLPLFAAAVAASGCCLLMLADHAHSHTHHLQEWIVCSLQDKVGLLSFQVTHTCLPTAAAESPDGPRIPHLPSLNAVAYRHCCVLFSHQNTSSCKVHSSICTGEACLLHVDTAQFGGHAK